MVNLMLVKEGPVGCKGTSKGKPGKGGSREAGRTGFCRACGHVGAKSSDIADVHFRELLLAAVWIMVYKRTGNHVDEPEMTLQPFRPEVVCGTGVEGIGESRQGHTLGYH